MEHYPNCKSDFSFTQIDMYYTDDSRNILQCNDCGAVEEIKGTSGPKEFAVHYCKGNEEAYRLARSSQQLLIGTPTGRLSRSEPEVQKLPNLKHQRRMWPEHPTLMNVDFAAVELRAAAWLNERFLLADLTSKIPEIVRVVNSGETCGDEFLLGSKPRRYTGYDPAFNGKSFSVPEMCSAKHLQRRWPADFPLIDVNADEIKEVGRTKFFNREYLQAPYQQPRFCAKCGGELTAHPRIGIYCQSCGEQPTLQQVCQHRFTRLGAQSKRRCIDCNAVEEDYLVCQRVGHEWRKQKDGSAVCARCGDRQSPPCGHKWDGPVHGGIIYCSICGVPNLRM